MTSSSNPRPTGPHAADAARRGLMRPADWRSLAIFAAIAAGFLVLPLIGSVRKPYDNKDYSTWLKMGQRVRQGEPIYPPDVQRFDHGFYYPSAVAVLLYAPVSYLGPTGGVIFFGLLTFIGHILAVLISVWFATGRVRDQHPAVYIIPVALTIPFVWDSYYLGQHNLTLLAVMLLGFVAIERGRAVRAGIWLAIPAAVKAFSFPVLFYLLWRRWWAAAGAMVVALVFLLLVLPGPFWGFQRTWQEMATWTERHLLSSSGEQIANQPGRAWRYGNQSLLSVVHRLTRDVQAGRGDEDLTVNVVEIGSRGAFAAFGLIAAAMTLAFILAMPRRDRRTRRTAGLEYAIVLLLIVMFSPKAGTYYYCWMIPGLTMTTAELLRAPRGSARRRWLAAGLVGLTAVMATGLLQPIHRLPQALGSTMWGGMILYVMLTALLARVKPGEARPDDLTQPGAALRGPTA